MGKRSTLNFKSRAVHRLQGRVLEMGVDLVKVRDVNGSLFSCTTYNFVEERDGWIYFAAGQMIYVGQESLDPATLNLAWQPHIRIGGESVHDHSARNYGLNTLAHPAGVTLSTDEGLAVMRSFQTAPDYAVALVWFYVFGSYCGEIRFSDIVWTGEPGRSPLYIRQNGREAHLVGLAREYVAFWWGLCGGWGNAPNSVFPLPSSLAFREHFRLEPDSRRARLLSEARTTVWTDDTDKFVLPFESFYELRLKSHSVYFGRASDSMFVLTTGPQDIIPDALPYPHADLPPWPRERRVQCAMEFKVQRASLATSLGLPHFTV